MTILLETERLILRNWQESDGDLFHQINSDDKVMEFFPFRRDRQKSDEMRSFLTQYISQKGFGFAAVELKETGECVGFNGLYADPDLQTFFDKRTIEIGWRLAPQYWGKGYAFEAAAKWLEYGFDKLALDEIVSFAVWSNQASFAVMKRIGLKPDPTRDYDHPGVPDSHSHLKRHLFYKITREEWLSNKKGD